VRQQARRRGRRQELGDDAAVRADLDAPADRRIGLRENLDHFKVLRQSHLRAAFGVAAAHAEKASRAQLCDQIVGQMAQGFDFGRSRGDRGRHGAGVGEDRVGGEPGPGVACVACQIASPSSGVCF
jgi:hypothetical protein